jgi:hypothetical protein
MAKADNREQRYAIGERRRPLRPIRCMNCGALLTYERRGSVVRLYASGTAAPLRATPVDEPNTPAAAPRCVVCGEPLLPIDTAVSEEQQLA